MKETELTNGNIDLIWNGYTMTPEREKKVASVHPSQQASSCHALCRPYSRGTLHRYADILLQDSLDQSFHSL